MSTDKKNMMGTRPVGVVFRAVPDSTLVIMRPDGKGFVKPVWPNYTVIPNNLFDELQQIAPMLWYPAPRDLPLPETRWAVNMCADADEYANALDWLEETTKKWNIGRVFNNPTEIKKTRRDSISETLSGIPGLHVPKCVRFLADHPDKFFNTFKDNGFEYPVLIRVATSQSGQNMAKIDNADDWDRIYAIPWGGQQVYMTEFVDFAGPKGDYTKLRITIIGGEMILRHAHFGEQWKVHFTIGGLEKVQRELELLEKLGKSEKLKNIVSTVQQRIDLDFWGLDIGYIDDEQDFVFFEGNAAMSMIPPQRRRQRTKEELAARAMKEHIGKTVGEKLRMLLFAPQRWNPAAQSNKPTALLQ